LDSNFFFYDGMYWVYQDDDWYASSWYSGPWARVAPAVVPLFILRVPVSYYRNPPGYFHGWRPDAPPRWGEHWGRDGSNSEAAGTDGIAVPRQRLARDGVEAARATAITLTYAEDL